MKYLSVCSGIEAATVAWHDLGWEPVGFSEFDAFPSAVLNHHYPDVTNFGDMTKYKEWNLDTVNLLVGGTPCQSFSVAGLRKGLEDPRGNLMLTYCGILDHFRPQWFVWENVPGVLSSNGGRDFGSFLGAVAELGYGFSYRVLDAQYFGVAQRRRRVFVVGHFGDWRPAAKVLFEFEGVRRDTAPSREAGKGFARTSGTLTANGGGLNRPAGNANELDFCIPTTFDRQSSGEYGTSPVASTMAARDYKGVRGIVAQPVSFACAEVGPAMGASGPPYSRTGNERVETEALAITGMAVRRLTPVECERLQGFPDGYTNVPWRKKDESPDGPRYKALGNSMAVPVMAWIGKRIQKVQDEQ